MEELKKEPKTKKTKVEETVKNLTISECLNRVQVELKAPKGQYNGFGKYKYRSCEDILEGVKPLLDKYKCLILLNDDIVLIGDRYYVKATASFIKGEDVISTNSLARECLDKKGMDSAQVTGATSSYARKYALNGLLCIDDTKDQDTMDNSEKPISSDQIKTLQLLGVDEKQLCSYFNVVKIQDLTYEQGKVAINMKSKK